MSPAWRRYSITRLALAERRWLCDELSARGHQANSVIVADDDNLDIAQEYGFETVERDNTDLGARFNAGFQYAADQGCDLFVHVGSDDWIHPDTFNVLDKIGLDGCLVAQRRFVIADLDRGTARRCYAGNMWGSIPWLIPRSAMAAFAPIRPGLMRGIDAALAIGLTSRINWIFQDSQPEWCVDWKTTTNLTPYRGVAYALGFGDEQEPWPLLSGFYPAYLIEQARSLSEGDRCAS